MLTIKEKFEILAEGFKMDQRELHRMEGVNNALHVELQFMKGMINSLQTVSDEIALTRVCLYYWV